MKKITLNILYILLVVLFSCNKENDTFADSNYDTFLSGQWVSENWDTLTFISDNLFLYNLNGNTDLYRYGISTDTMFIDATVTSSFIPVEDFWTIRFDLKKNRFSIIYNKQSNPVDFKKLD